MRICFFVGSMHLGGIGKLTLNLIKQFVGKGIHVDLFLLKKGGEYMNEVPAEVNVYIAEGNAISRIYKFIAYLNKKKPQVSISARQRQDLINIFSCLISVGKTKPVISIHTNLTVEYRHGGKKKNFFPKISKLLYRIPKKFIAVSKGVADDFSDRTKVPRDKIQVIYNPVYEIYKNEGLQSSLPAFEDLKKKDKKFIITAARFTEQKDLSTLIQAFSIVRKQIDLSLVLLGDGPQKKDIQNLIEKLKLTNHVVILGYVKKPQYFIQNASVFVLSSKWEGFGNVLVEAMGVGVPVVSTNCPSGPAEILENGKYGNLVPVENPQKMAKAIVDTYNNPLPAEVLIKRAEDFSIPKIAEEYLQYIYA